MQGISGAGGLGEIHFLNYHHQSLISRYVYREGVGSVEGGAATGIAQIVECVWQLTGSVPRRQVQCNVALAQSIGGPGTNNWVTLLEAR